MGPSDGRQGREVDQGGGPVRLLGGMPPVRVRGFQNLRRVRARRVPGVHRGHGQLPLALRHRRVLRRRSLRPGALAHQLLVRRIHGHLHGPRAHPRGGSVHAFAVPGDGGARDGVPGAHEREGMGRTPLTAAAKDASAHVQRERDCRRSAVRCAPRRVGQDVSEAGPIPGVHRARGVGAVHGVSHHAGARQRHGADAVQRSGRTRFVARRATGAGVQLVDPHQRGAHAVVREVHRHPRDGVGAHAGQRARSADLRATGHHAGLVAVPGVPRVWLFPRLELFADDDVFHGRVRRRVLR
mmetsp:Transcript_826/g.3768  ORF Transcript_826/g.3768 Transcript_826/m.3768 type:complete len:297 (+) Transcript_826:1808-2698(+)